MDEHDTPAEEPVEAAPSSEEQAGQRAEAASGEPDWKRKRRLAEIFGDVLPSTTSDERGTGAPRRTDSAQDAWLKSQVPPHHGGH